MAKPGRKPSLSKLEEQKAALNAKIAKLRQEERKQRVALEKQRYAILGRALAKELAENQELSDRLFPLINARITKATERKLLDLPPIEKETPSAGQ